MFIGMVKTKKNEEYTIKTENFLEAWNFLHETAQPLSTDVLYAVVLEDVRWNDGHYIYPHKVVASMRMFI